MRTAGAHERVWLSRARWRVLGATLWPAFVVLTVLEAVYLVALPPWERAPDHVAGSLIVAGFANLFVVAVVVPLAGRRVARRLRPDMPRAVADDVAGTALLVVAAAGWVVVGLAHRPAEAAERAERLTALGALHGYVVAEQPALRRELARADTMRLEPDFYRACVPAGEPRRAVCLLVDTAQQPPGVRLDADRLPNVAYRLGGFE